MPDYFIKTVDRDRWYFDQYEYCGSFAQNDIYLIRGLDKTQYEKSLAYSQRWPSLQPGKQLCREYLDQTFDFLSTAAAPIKVTFSWIYCYVYTNDLDWISDIVNQCPHVQDFKLSQAVITKPRDVVSMLDPKYQYRTWFRERWTDAETKSRLKNWLAQNTEVKISQSLNHWLDAKTPNKRLLTARHFYIDYNSAQYETMLNMLVPGLIRRTQPIVARTK